MPGAGGTAYSSAGYGAGLLLLLLLVVMLPSGVEPVSRGTGACG
jgi:hypothetical protein